MKKNITSLNEILDDKYGKRGTSKREEWEQKFEAFRLDELIEDERTKPGMKQDELTKEHENQQNQ